MSSFIGHAVTGFVISRFSKKKATWRWTAFLVFLAMLVDINYLAVWFLGKEYWAVYSHSIGFVLVVSLLIIGFLYFKKIEDWKSRSLQVFLVLFSHLLLDTLVGVFPKYYLWPFYQQKLNIFSGILPSAGQIHWANYYFYRNLFIEMGILLPFFGILYLLYKRKETKYLILKTMVLLVIWIPFLIKGLSLYRG